MVEEILCNASVGVLVTIDEQRKTALDDYAIRSLPNCLIIAQDELLV